MATTPEASPNASMILAAQKEGSPRNSADIDDPDVPVPSVEQDAGQSVRSTTPGETIFTPPSTIDPDCAQTPSLHSLNNELDSLVLDSKTSVSDTSASSTPAPESRQPTRHESTPSIHITRTATFVTAQEEASSEFDSSIASSQDADFATARQMTIPLADNARSNAETPPRENLNPSPSPTPSRRRRSSSVVSHRTHVVEDEEPPQSLFHQRQVQDALSNAKRLAADMVDALSSSDLHREQGSTIHELHQQAVRLAAFEPPSTRTVGLVGDSGAGKSSLINSLLDKPQLARASGSGAACTCVVTEYHYHNLDDYRIHVDYFTPDEIREQFSELLHAYRRYHSPREGLTKDEVKELEDTKVQSDLAMHTFKAAFRERLEQNKSILLSRPFDDVLEIMMGWTHSLLSRSSDEDTLRVLDNSEECAKHLVILTSESDAIGERSIWPFIRRIKVFLRAHILNRGLVIADLPGLRDLNSARQNITERYVRSCHQVLAVVSITRAKTDVSVKDVLELARRARLSNVGIVCTHSENIRWKEAPTDYPKAKTAIQDKQRRIDRAEQREKVLKFEIEDLDEDFDNLSNEEKQELNNLRREERNIRALIESNDFGLQRLVIGIRNEAVIEELQLEYRNHPAVSSLEVFCVSNKLYEDYRDKPLDPAKDFLTLSGIIRLRKYCISLVADSHLRATTDYINDEIPAFLGSVDLWIQAGSGSSSAERKQHIQDTVSAVQQLVEELTFPLSQVRGLTLAIRHEFNTLLSEYMRQQAPRWRSHAHQTSVGWHREFHHSSYSAWCRNYGDHYTKTVGQRCWNEEAIAAMNKDMTSRWEALIIKIDNMVISHRLVGMVFQRMDQVLRDASNVRDDSRLILQTLTATLKHRSHALSYELDELIDEFKIQLADTRTDAFEPMRTSFVGILMENAYKSAQQEFGTGSVARKGAIINGSFGSPKLFPEHRRMLQKKFDKISTELQNKVVKLVEEQVEFIKRDLQTLKDENAVTDSERNPQFRVQVRESANKAREEVEWLGEALEGVLGTA